MTRAGEKLLDQLTIQEAAEFVSTGNMIYLDIPSVGFLGGTLANDGPVGFLSSISNVSDANSPWYVSPEDPNAGYEVHDMGTPQLVGASFDKELARQSGHCSAMTAFSTGCRLSGGRD